MKKILLLFFISLSFQLLSQQGDANLKHWKVWSDKNNSDSIRVAAIDDLAWSYININLDSAILFSEMELKFATEKKFKKWIALAYNNIGLVNRYRGDNMKALDLFERALAIRIETDDKNGIASSYANISNVYGQMSDYKQALENLFKALKIFEEIGNKVGQAKTKSDIAIYYSTMQDNKKALQYFSSSLKLSEEAKDDYSIALALGNIGMVYVQLGKPEKALPFVIKGQLIDEKIGNTYGQIIKIVSISMIYRGMGEYEKALEAQDKASKLCAEINYNEGIISSEVNYGTIYYKQKKYAESIKHFEIGKRLAKEAHNIRNEKDCYKGLYLSKKEMGDFKAAISDYEVFNTLEDSIFKQENIKEANRKEFQFTYEKKATADSVKSVSEKKIIKAQLKQEQTQRYALYGGLLVMFVFAGFIFNRFKVSQKQKNIIQLQKHIVDEKQKEILDSISYAKRIQDTILPSVEFWNKHLPSSFILYKPKDIVAGDFYWMESIKTSKADLVLFAAADCTGHGVPGALVSVVCSDALNKAVLEYGLIDPGKLLNKARSLIIEKFSKSGQEIKDGMDISLCVLNTFTNELFWAGANNPLWVLSAGEINEIKADKMPIGQHITMQNFTTHTLQLKKEDMIYVFTDGYADQFGGPDGKKFKYKQLKELLLSVYTKPLAVQNEVLDKTFEEWKKNVEQIDDVCIIGVRV